MPSPLQNQSLGVLLGLRNQAGSSGQVPVNPTSPEDMELDTMIPEEALYSAQDEIGARGRESGGAYAIPSRESLRASGRSGLRRMFGEIEAKGRAEAAPQHVAGQYGLRQAQIEAEGNLAAAQAKAERDASNQDLSFQRDMYKTQFQSDAQDKRAQAGRDAQAQVRRSAQKAVAARQNAAALIQQAALVDKQAQKSWDLMGMGGKRGLEKKANELRAQAQQLTMQADMAEAGTDGGGDVEIDAHDLAQRLGLSTDQAAMLAQLLGS